MTTGAPAARRRAARVGCRRRTCCLFPQLDALVVAGARRVPSKAGAFASGYRRFPDSSFRMSSRSVTRARTRTAKNGENVKEERAGDGDETNELRALGLSIADR
jgi:hypothetical protein